MKTMDEYKDYPDEVLEKMTVDDISVEACEPFEITLEDRKIIKEMYGIDDWVKGVSGIKRKYNFMCGPLH